MTLSYKQCKNLKEKGFRQFGEGYAIVPHKVLPESDETVDVINWQTYIHNTSLHHKEMVYSSTLEELIEVCIGMFGKYSFVLKQFNIADAGCVAEIEYMVSGSLENPIFDIRKGHGETPIEAVYNLYMAL